MKAALVALLAAGSEALAAGLPVQKKSHPAVHADQPAYATTVQVRFLGAAGFLIRRGKDVVLTAPLYSTPNLFKVLNEKEPVILPRPERIARFHPDVDDVQAILVGHAHYDHLMDVPYVWERTPGALIFGSLATRNILVGYQGQAPPGVKKFPPFVPKVDPTKVVALDDPADPSHFKVDVRSCAGFSPRCDPGHACPALPATHAGNYVSVSPKVRIRAFCARHPPQFLKHHQAPCCVASPRSTPPASIDDFREGTTLEYLVDFLGEDGTPAFRVFYQDVPVDGRVGLLPADVLAERPVDLALLCAGNAGDVTEPEGIVGNLGAGAVIVGHWEDFFRPQDQPLGEAPFQNIGKYYRCLRRELDLLPGGADRPLYLPAPGVLMTFPPPS